MPPSAPKYKRRPIAGRIEHDAALGLWVSDAPSVPSNRSVRPPPRPFSPGPPRGKTPSYAPQGVLTPVPRISELTGLLDIRVSGTAIETERRPCSRLPRDFDQSVFNQLVHPPPHDSIKGSCPGCRVPMFAEYLCLRTILLAGMRSLVPGRAFAHALTLPHVYRKRCRTPICIF